ncbi:hypothetical protein ACQKWADRAFT_19264 [Trichoderma austrokoningii]
MGRTMRTSVVLQLPLCCSAIGLSLKKRRRRPLELPHLVYTRLFEPLKKYCTLRSAFNSLTWFYNGIEKSIGRIDIIEIEYGKQWYTNQLIETLSFRDEFEHGVDVFTIEEIILGFKVQHTPEQRSKLDEAVTKLVYKLTGAYSYRYNKFINQLNVMLLKGLLDPKNARKEFLCSLFDCILQLAISQLDLKEYGGDSGVLPEFYKRTLAHDKASATRLQQQILKDVSLFDGRAMLNVLRSLVEEPSLVDTPSPEVQTWLETFVEAYITNFAGKEPEEPGNWARPAELRNCYSYKCMVCPRLNSFLSDRRAKDIIIALDDFGQYHAKLSFRYLFR